MSNVSEPQDTSTILASISHGLWRAACRHNLLAWLAVLAPWIILRQFWILIMGLGLITLHAWWLRSQIKKAWVSWANAAFPELEDSVQLLVEKSAVKLAEDQANKSAKNSSLLHLQQQRLLGRVTRVLHPAACRQLVQQHLAFPRSLIAVSWISALLVFFLPMQASTKPGAVADQRNAVDAQWRMSMHVVPPAYTGLASVDTSPKELQVPENSLVKWCIQGNQSGGQNPTLTLSHGQEIPFTVSDDNKQLQTQMHAKTQSQTTTNANSRETSTLCASWQASETVFWSWSGDAGKSRTVLKVILDQAPQIKIEQPIELLQILSTDARQVKIALRIDDDYKINQATMHMTLARGSGENIRFSDKELPIPQGKNPQTRQWDKTWSLSELGMEAGDELYFFVRATDNADKNPHISRSATYTLRLPAPETQAEETSALPMLAKPESLRSQRQIIIDTEQLVADMKANPKMNPNLIRTRSEAIAGDQGTLRRRYGKFLGEESSLFGDEDHEEGHSADDGHDHGDAAPQNLAAQYGHAHDQEENATLFDEATKKILRRALVAMWDAEKALRAISPASALAPENKALEAIKQLQQADRIYLHKAAFTPPAIKEEKRLTGDVLDLKNTQKKQDAAQQIVPEDLLNLLRALQSETVLPALWSKTARSWIALHLNNEEQRLAAQAAILDVENGCLKCRPVLAAWLRQAIPQPELILQGRTVFQSKRESEFEQAWKKLGQLKQEAQAKQEGER